MESLIWIVTALIALGGVVLICLLFNMIRTGDYSALVGGVSNGRQDTAQSQSQRIPTETETSDRFADLADLLILRREPEVAHFSQDPLEITDEEQKKRFAEDLSKIRKRSG